MFGALQWLVVLILSLAAFFGAVWGLIDATRYSASAYEYAGKLTKQAWIAILAVCALVAFISLPAPVGRGSGILGFLGIAVVAAVAVYFTGVRPKLRGLPGGGERRSSGGW